MNTVRRRDDMGMGTLILHRQEDGDIELGIIPASIEAYKDAGFSQSVEFCTMGMGGGRSPRTLRALHDLMDAIEHDNRDWPDPRVRTEEERSER